MTLLVDVGNSAIKWALLLDGKLGDAQWQSYRQVPDVAAQLAARWGKIPHEVQLVGCNVAGAALGAAVERAAGTAQLGSVRWLHTQRSFAGPFSLTNGYRNALQLGVDRWHCMLGACSMVGPETNPRGLIVVNAGTATTVDCIESTEPGGSDVRFAGRFIGGMIAPGIRLMIESLQRETAELPAASGEPAAFPDNTDAAIVTGVLDAQAGLVQRVWQRFAGRLGKAPVLLLSGGNAAALAPLLSAESAAIEDNLVLRGLAVRASEGTPTN